MTSQRFQIKDFLPAHLASRAGWPQCNRQCYLSFCEWLRLNGCAEDTRRMDAVAAHLTLGILNKPHLEIDLSVDLERIREYILRHDIQTQYNNGLVKFGEYLSIRQSRASRSTGIHWEYYLAGVPENFHAQVREYIAHRQKGWRAEDRKRLAIGLISSLGQTLRKLMKSNPLKELRDITPQAWFNTLDEELGESYHPRTINARFSILKSFLRFVDEHGTQVCQRIFLAQPLKCGARIPRDASVLDLRQLLEENQREMNAAHTSQHDMGVMDCVWFNLMLYSGMRTCEVRRLKLEDIHFETRRIRIEQSKGLKDRLIFMNSATVSALNAWLELRRGSKSGSEHVFHYRHLPLSPHYCQHRLRMYGKRCGVKVTPHQLRHSCATLLLNAGAPVLSVQFLLGHEKLDTTLGYARLYDGTVAADYYRAMAQVEGLFDLREKRRVLFTPVEMVALLDSLSRGTLNESQRETVHSLRQGILALAEVSV
jgi:site-specific recombinase XerD